MPYITPLSIQSNSNTYNATFNLIHYTGIISAAQPVIATAATAPVHASPQPVIATVPVQALPQAINPVATPGRGSGAAAALAAGSALLGTAAAGALSALGSCLAPVLSGKQKLSRTKRLMSILPGDKKSQSK